MTGSPQLDLAGPQLNALYELADDEGRRVYLNTHPDLVTSDLAEQLAESVRQLLRVNLDEALRRADCALAIAQELGSDESLARALRAKANALWFKGQCRPAIGLLERAAALFESTGRTDELGRTLSTSIQPLILLGEYEQALRNADIARAIFTRQPDPLRLARLELNVGNIYHRQERFAEALSIYERLYPRLLEHRDAEGTGAALHNMAVCLISLDAFDRAFEIYGKARDLFQRHDMPLLESQADYNIAYLYYLRGDFERALNALRNLREACAANGDAYHAALCNLDLSEIYLDVNLVDEAANLAQDAANRFEHLGMAYEAARSLTNLAIAHVRREARPKALALFERAKEIFVREQHAVGKSLIDLYQAMLLFEAGDFTSATALCLEARAFFHTSGLARRVIVCDLLLSRLALSEGDPEQARVRCQMALDELAAIEAPVLSYYAHLQLGRVREAAGELEQSLRAYHLARKQLEDLRSTLQGEELRIGFMKDKLDVYQQLVRLCLEKGSSGRHAEEAFGFVEEAKSRSLLDSIYGRTHPLPARIAGESRCEENLRSLRRKLNSYYRRIELEQLSQDGFSAGRLRALREQASACEDALVQGVREIPAGTVPLREVPESGVLSMDEIRAALDPGTVLIQHFQIGEQILAAVVTRQRIEVVPLTVAARIRKRLQMLQLQLLKFRLGAAYTGPIEKGLRVAADVHLREIYEEIVAPLRPLLDGDHLVWVPHGVLHYVPLHALHDGTGYLIDRFTVSYAPSASIYALCNRRPPLAARPSLIMGVPDERTPWIRREVEEVAAFFPDARVVLGAGADEKLLREWGPQSGHIHIATHGFFRKDNPLFSGVRLGDGYLNLYDLYSLKLPVGLLALSGCATGINVVSEGDELLGLTRGLLYGGAQTLLLTLWDVHDRSTAEFMRCFYAHLRSGLATRVQALRAAMMELRLRYPHPFHWAPFILVGKSS